MRRSRSLILTRDARDAILFFAGLIGVGHEMLIASEPREVLVLLFAAMMGLPAFLRVDEQKRNGNGNGG
jgi:hypothetical protein